MPKFPSTLGSIGASVFWVQSALEWKEILQIQGPWPAMHVEVDLDNLGSTLSCGKRLFHFGVVPQMHPKDIRCMLHHCRHEISCEEYLRNEF